MPLSAEQLQNEIQIAPVAIPISEQELREADIQINDLAEALIVDETTEVNICLPENYPKDEDTKAAIDKILPKNKGQGYVSKEETLVVERIAPAYEQGPRNSVPLGREGSLEKVKVQSGIPYYIAASVTLGFYLSVLATVVCVVFLYLDQTNTLLLIAPTVTLVLTGLFLSLAYPVKCCVCHHKLFVKHHSRKKKNAHYLPLLGYIIPTSLHIMFTGWFTCMHCGSEVSLFKKHKKKS